MSAQKDKTPIDKALDVFNKATERETGFVVAVRTDIRNLVERINFRLEGKFTISPNYTPHVFNIWRKDKGLKVEICSKTRKVQVQDMHQSAGKGVVLSKPDEKPTELSPDEALSVIAQKMADIVQHDPKLVKRFQEEKRGGQPQVTTQAFFPQSPPRNS